MAKNESGTPSHVPLSKERVLRAAVAIADAGGIEALTMRKLAQDLGVEAASLYNYVANKGEILNGIIDIVLGEVELPAGEDEWKTAMRKRAISFRQVLLRHPWAISLAATQSNPGPSTLRFADSVLACLRKADFSVAMSLQLFSALDSYIYGFAMQEVSYQNISPKETKETVDTILQRNPADEYPYVTEVITQHYLKYGYNPTKDFEFGLNLILDSLETASEPV